MTRVIFLIGHTSCLNKVIIDQTFAKNGWKISDVQLEFLALPMDK